MAKLPMKQQVKDLIVELNKGLVAFPITLWEVTWNKFNLTQQGDLLLKENQPIQHIFWLLTGIRTGIRYYKDGK